MGTKNEKLNLQRRFIVKVSILKKELKKIEQKVIDKKIKVNNC